MSRLRGITAIATVVTITLGGTAQATTVSQAIKFDYGKLQLGGSGTPASIVDTATPANWPVLTADVCTDTSGGCPAVGDFTVTIANFNFPPYTSAVAGVPGETVTVDVKPLSNVTGHYDLATGALSTNASDYEADITLAGSVAAACKVAPIPLAVSTANQKPFLGDPFDPLGALGEPRHGVIDAGWSTLPTPQGQTPADDSTCAPLDQFTSGPGGIAFGRDIDPVLAPPATPAITGSGPTSPANDNDPELVGTTDPNTTVALYTNSTCAGLPVAQGSAAAFTSSGITVHVADNSVTYFYATARYSGSQPSGCSTPAFTYEENSTGPAPPSIDSPPSPANNNDPALSGTVDPNATTVKLYANKACLGTPVAQGSATTFEGPGIPVHVLDDTTTYFYAAAVNALGTSSACSSPAFTYVEDSSADTPTFANTDPVSGSNDNNPRFLGVAEAHSIVRLYATSGCSGPPVASDSAANFAAPGILVPVADNSSTTLYAQATDLAGNVSGCSAPITYVERTTLRPTGQRAAKIKKCKKKFPKGPKRKKCIKKTKRLPA